MNIRSNSFRSASKVAALALAAGLLTLGTTSAQAQWFRWSGEDAALPGTEVVRLLQESGYRLTGPIYRNRQVYVANVLGNANDAERLIIDAHDGRLLQRYAVRTRRAPAFAGDWSTPRPRVSSDDAWLENGDDFGASPLRPPRTDEVARADNSASSPYVILAPPATPHEPALEKPRPKPQVRHKKLEPTPAALPAATPAPVDAKASPAGAPPAAAAVTPATPQADAVATTAPRVADTKATPAPEIATPARAAPPAPKAAKPNDVPVAPLE